MQELGEGFSGDLRDSPCAESGVMGSDSHTSLDGVVVTLRDASEMGETVRRLRVRVAEVEAQMERMVLLTKPPRREG